MKKTRFLLLQVLFLYVTCSFAQNLTYTYEFEHPDLSKDKNGFTAIHYSRCLNLGSEGDPSLPYFGVNLLLPQNSEISRIRVVSISYYPEESNILIQPSPRKFPISHPAAPDYQPVPNPLVYQSADAYPAAPLGQASTQYLCGHSIGFFTICPVSWRPAEQEARFIRSVTLEVETHHSAKSGELNDMLKTSPGIEERISSMVQNPEMLVNYSYSDAPLTTSYDILLISNTTLMPGFSTYINYKKSTGFSVATITTSTIYSTYTGADNQTKIRNCIKDYYQTYGISYVILGGDADAASATDNIIPKRGFYCNVPGTPEDDLPSDMYYGCLDGTWNNNNNSYWGEPGEEDFLAEVSVGRICVDNTTEVQNFTNKLQMYQNAPVEGDIRKALMLGEQLDASTYGDTYKDEIANGSSANGYTTTGIPSSFTISKLYDSQASWSGSSVYNKFNTGGINLLNHLGHANVTYNMKLYNSDITTTNFTNNGVTKGFVVGYSQGCYNGSFDNRDDGGSYGTEDCFAEKITTIATAEVANISNSRYGWYAPSSTDGPSQYFDRQFFDAIFGENITGIGDANADSKEDNVAYIQADPDQTLKWCCYETNLFGDPSMDIWTNTPSAITATFPSSISIGQSTVSFTTNTPYARIGLMQNGDLIGRVVANASGSATVTTFNPVTSPNNITVSIIGHNKSKFTGTIVVVSNQPYVIYENNQVNDPSGNNNGMLDYGESVTLNLGLKNVGTQPAASVAVTLSESDPYITITDSTENYGNFTAGQVVTMSNAFAFQVASNIPDNHQVTFNVKAVGSATWMSSFTLTAHAPVLAYQSYSISDPAGNNNGKLDPGENADFNIIISNSGSSPATAVTGMLTSTDPYVTISGSPQSYGTLSAGGTAQQTFSVVASASAPAGHIAAFSFNISAGGGLTASGSFSVVIGQIPVLILDLDDNHSSGPAMQTAVQANNVAVEYLTSFPANINLYTSVFVCLGIYSDNHVLTSAEGQVLADFVNAGGKLYMEGGDTWYYDAQTPVHSLFNITATSDGSGDLATLQGQTGTFTAGMNFQYGGENSWIDHITSISPAYVILKNSSPSYGTAVANPAASYKTIGASHEFGGITDGASPNTKAQLMAKYLTFFGLLNTTVAANFSANPLTLCSGGSVNYTSSSTGPVTSYSWSFPGGNPQTSVSQNPVVSYASPGTYSATLTVTGPSNSNSLTKNNYITVNPGPSITGNPVNSTITEGNDATFTVSASSASMFAWKVSTDNGATWTTLVTGAHYSGVNTPVLNILAATLSMNNYQYKCTVSGSCPPAATSNAATLAVNPVTPPITTTVFNNTVCAGEVRVPVYVTNFNDVASASLSLEINLSVLSYSGYEDVNPSLASGMLLVNLLGSQVRLSWFSVSPVFIGSDTLLKLVFSAVPGISQLEWDVVNPGNCQYSNLDGVVLNASFTDGVLNVLGCNNLAGTVAYDNSNATPLNNVIVYLSNNGINVAQTTTDATGHYSFLSLPTGSFTLGAACTKPWGGVNSVDALYVMKDFVGIEHLAGIRELAADVDASGYVNSLDALSVSRRFVGQVTSFPAGDWAFENHVVNMDGTSNVVDNFKGLCFGDVNGTYEPVARITPSLWLVSNGSIPVGIDGSFTVPVTAGRDLQAGAVALIMDYPSNVSVTGVALGAPSDDQLLYTARNGELRISWYSLSPLHLLHGEVLLWIKGKVLDPGLTGESGFTLNPLSEIADPDAVVIHGLDLLMPKLSMTENGLRLGDNFPDPFVNQTTISYSLPGDGNVELRIFNLLGEEVRTLVHAFQPAGTYCLNVDGSLLRPGSYLYRLEFQGNSGSASLVGKMFRARQD